MEEELLLLLGSDEELDELDELSLADLVAVSDFESVGGLESPEELELVDFESDEDELSLEPFLLSGGVFGLP